MGAKVAKMLAKEYKNMDSLSKASFMELQAMNDVGEVMANSIVEFFAQEQTKDLLNKLKQAGVNMNSLEENIDDKLKGKIFVITGTLETYARKEIENLIEKHGGKTSNTVSKKTDYLIAGENAGSKLKKAQELEIKIISEKEFENILN